MGNKNSGHRPCSPGCTFIYAIQQGEKTVWVGYTKRGLWHRKAEHKWLDGREGTIKPLCVLQNKDEARRVEEELIRRWKLTKSLENILDGHRRINVG